MGNDQSSSVARRTLISSDDSSCWTLYNGVNDRTEPISFFLGKQTFSVECRRSIQFLKTIRHPNIVKFFSSFKTFVDHDSFIADCVHPLSQKIQLDNSLSDVKISLGLFQIGQALEFLHSKAKISHNNVCLSSIYSSSNGLWKLGNFECACRHENLNKKFLSSLKLIRSEKCVTPEENDQQNVDFDPNEISSIDIFGLGTLTENLLENLGETDRHLTNLLNNFQISLTNENPQSRPHWSKIFQMDLFQMNFIKVTELLDRLPTVDETDLDEIVDSLSNFLDELKEETFNELLIRRLFVPFIFFCSTTRRKLLPRILIPKIDENHSWISIENFRQFAVPMIVDLFSYHVTSIRLTLLEYFQTYLHLIDQSTLTNVVLPQLVYGLKDANNEICRSTLIALAALVPVLGADVVVGGQRKQIFTDKIKKEIVVFPKDLKKQPKIDSSPPHPRPPPPSPLPVTFVVEEKPPAEKVETPSVVYQNGHSTPTPIEQSEEEEEKEEDQWSDWEPPVLQETIPTKTFEIKSNRNLDASLGSEFEIPTIVSKNNVVQDEIDDFFKDMAPKVETVELMKQLETMFDSSTTNSTGFSSKFGVVQQDQNDNQENESGNAWDD